MVSADPARRLKGGAERTTRPVPADVQVVGREPQLGRDFLRRALGQVHGREHFGVLRSQRRKQRPETLAYDALVLLGGVGEVKALAQPFAPAALHFATAVEASTTAFRSTR